MIFKFKGKQVFYTVEGKGSPLVLLHGFLESSSMWKEIARELSSHFTVITLDLPGHGKTAVFDKVHPMEFMATVVNALVSDITQDPIFLIGHSMGGYVALAFAEHYPEKVSKLILLNSTTMADAPERVENRNRAIELIKNEKLGFISSAIPLLFSEDSRKRYGKEIEQLIEEARQFSSTGIVANIRGMRDRKDRTSTLKAFNRPKMLISGENDPIIPLNHSESLAIAAETPIEILPGSHMSWLENKDEIVKIVHFIENNGI